jgi:ABC-type glycerol-3-phosphate transport system substrate-binding protein
MPQILARVMGALILILLIGSVSAQDTAPTTTPAPTVEISVWLPDLLDDPDHAEAVSLLQAQTDAFTESEGVIVDTRRKLVGVTGGIMSTIRSASNVAAGALPTLTLMRRHDLINAQRDGLIESLEGRVPSTVQGELDTALQLGQIQGELYGVPYLLEIEHVIYHPRADVAYDDWSYDAFLARGEDFAFIAEQSNEISTVFLLQYLNSGGTIARDGTLTLNEPALLTALGFYEQAHTNGLIGETLYASSQAYLPRFIENEINIGVFDSTTYLSLYTDDTSLRVAPVPTADGASTALFDGWMWVLVSGDASQQEAAIQYINWLMDFDRQAEYGRVVTMLPSQRSALERGIAHSATVQPYLDLLDNAVIPITESEGGALAIAMQEALIAVITGNRTAEQATQDVIRQQSNTP